MFVPVCEAFAGEFCGCVLSRVEHQRQAAAHPQKQKEAGWHTGPWWIRSLGCRVIVCEQDALIALAYCPGAEESIAESGPERAPDAEGDIESPRSRV